MADPKRVAAGKRAGRRGYQLEKDVVNYLRNNGFLFADRPRAGGKRDKGDVNGVHSPPEIAWTLQCKNYKNLTEGLNAGMNGLRAQVAHAGAHFGAVVSKRRGKGVHEAIVSMPLDMFVSYLRYNNPDGTLVKGGRPPELMKPDPTDDPDYDKEPQTKETPDFIIPGQQ